MTQFANLPDDCYYLIFVRLSTSTLLSCRRVSRAWLRNQQNVCRNRKVLILLQGDSPVKLLTKSHFQSAFISHGIDQNGQLMDFDHFLQHNRVKLRTFNQNVTHFLAGNFPNVDTLFVIHRNILSQDVIEPLLDLLQLFSSQMVTLKLYFNYRSELLEIISQNILKVIRQLNSMSALEHVTLESHNHSTLSLKVSVKTLKFLTRVKQFYFYSKKISQSWIDVLRKLEKTGSVSQLERIGIDNNLWTRSFENWPLVNRFTHFPGSMFDLDFNVHNLEQSICHFRSLTTFAIDDYSSLSLASQLTILSNHCPSLVHISIKITKNCLFVQPFDPSTIKSFESMKALDLQFHHSDSRIKMEFQTQVRQLVHTFPNLVSIRIVIYKPDKLMIFRNQQNLDAEFVNCFRQLKVALGRESLRTVIEYQM